MTGLPKISISWSGGKDSAQALSRLLSSQQYEVDHLHTVIDKASGRVGLHGVREELIDQQAKSLGIPLKKLYLEASGDHDNYEKLVSEYYISLKKRGIVHVMFGDIFLEDLKTYRDIMLSRAGLKGVYPIWSQSTSILIEEFIAKGFKTVICAANKKYFKHQDMGVVIDQSFVDGLTAGVDPCGENGEFHTFVFDGPIFNAPISFRKEEVVEKHYSYQRENDDGSFTKLDSTFLFQELK